MAFKTFSGINTVKIKTIRQNKKESDTIFLQNLIVPQIKLPIDDKNFFISIAPLNFPIPFQAD